MIEVKDNVFWNNDSFEQSEEAFNWLQEEVEPYLSEPTLDEFKRPLERVYENDRVKVTETQVYISESYDWARKGVEYKVELKEIEDETI